MTKKKKAKIELVSQTDDAESGLAAIIMVANYFGHDFDLTTMSRRYPSAGTRGLTVKDLTNMAADMQLASRVTEPKIDKFMSLRLPAILQWSKNQYVLLAGFDNGQFNIFHPADGQRLIPVKEVAQHYAGQAIEFNTKPDFKPEKARTELKLSMVAGGVKGMTRAVGYLSLMFFAVFMLSFIMPFYSMIVIDEAVNSQDITLLNSLLFAALAVAILQGMSEFLRDMLVNFIGGQFSLQSNYNLIERLIRLPMAYFESRHPSNIISRTQAIDEIKKIFTESLPKFLVDSMVLASILSLLFVYSWKLATILVAFCIITVGWRAAIFGQFSKHKAQAIESKAKESSSLLESIRGIQSIKLYGIEAERVNDWNRSFTRKLNSSIKSIGFITWWGALDRFGSTLETVIVLYVGARQVLQNDLTVGVLICFLTYKDKFIYKFLDFVVSIFTFLEMPIYLGRLSDIVVQNEEEVPPPREAVKIIGNFELKNLKFRYNPNEPFLFNMLNVKVELGTSIAIIGPSGCGKSTLLKIMLGLIEPHSGEILIDGHSISAHKKIYREAISTVMQNDTLLTGSILDNICFFSKSPNPEWAVECARLACIHEDIEKMSRGYQTQVSNFTSTVSGGQKQRILIARALYRRPKVLFMDEATSALDVKNERLVNKRLAELGITRVIIAHRPETINSADFVYILNEGRLELRDENVLSFGKYH